MLSTFPLKHHQKSPASPLNPTDKMATNSTNFYDLYRHGRYIALVPSALSADSLLYTGGWLLTWV